MLPFTFITIMKRWPIFFCFYGPFLPSLLCSDCRRRLITGVSENFCIVHFVPSYTLHPVCHAKASPTPGPFMPTWSCQNTIADPAFGFTLRALGFLQNRWKCCDPLQLQKFVPLQTEAFCRCGWVRWWSVCGLSCFLAVLGPVPEFFDDHPVLKRRLKPIQKQMWKMERGLHR